MKGISTETIILIATVILVMVVVALMWLRGFNPLGISIDEGMCRQQIMRACDSGDWSRVHKNCPKHFPGTIEKTLEACLGSSTPEESQDCLDVCSWVYQSR